MEVYEIKIDSKFNIVLPYIERFNDQEKLIVMDLIDNAGFVSVYTYDDFLKLLANLKNKEDMSSIEKRWTERLFCSSSSEVDVISSSGKIKLKLPKRIVDKNEANDMEMMCVVGENGVRLYYVSKYLSDGQNLENMKKR